MVENSNDNDSTVKVEPVYISGACNRCPKSLDWGGNDNQIIYGMSNAVAIMTKNEHQNSSPFQVNATLNSHTGRVNSVKWIRPSLPILKEPNESFEIKNEFVSASNDKTVKVWEGSATNYTPSQTLKGHSHNVSLVDAMYYKTTQSFDTIIVSASIDSTVRIWCRSKNEFSCEQVIESKQNGFALAVKLFSLPISNLPVLFIGYENHRIEVYVRLEDEENKTFKVNFLK
jgi:elongator complex protein 2